MLLLSGAVQSLVVQRLLTVRFVKAIVPKVFAVFVLYPRVYWHVEWLNYAAIGRL